MRLPRFALVPIVLALFAQFASAQQTNTQTVTSSAQAQTLLQNSLVAMGGNPPSDSTAAGTVTIVAGSETSQGTVSILTRGTSQTSIQFQTTIGGWSVIYSNAQANRVDSTGTTALPLELAASSQSAYFPLPFLSGLLSNPDVSLQYLGQETLGSSTANHIRAQNTFQSAAQMQFLSDFTITDIWLDAGSGFPDQPEWHVYSRRDDEIWPDLRLWRGPKQQWANRQHHRLCGQWTQHCLYVRPALSPFYGGHHWFG